MTTTRTIQLSVIGAMQRSSPGLTALWLKWSGIPDLWMASFDVSKSEDMADMGPATRVTLSAVTGNYQETQSAFCDAMGIPADGFQRRTMPIFLGSKNPAHPAFWSFLRRRELEEVEGPLEWWWALHVLRSRGIRQASRSLMAALFPDLEEDLYGCVVHLGGGSIKPGRRPEDLLVSGKYRQPTTLNLVFPGTGKQTAAVKLVGDFKQKFVNTLIDVGVSRGE